MLRTRLVSAICLFFLVFGMNAIQAGEPRLLHRDGIINAIDADKGTMVVDDMLYGIAQSTPVHMGRGQATYPASLLKVGYRVRLYVPVGGVMQQPFAVSSIDILARHGRHEK